MNTSIRNAVFALAAFGALSLTACQSTGESTESSTPPPAEQPATDSTTPPASSTMPTDTTTTPPAQDGTTAPTTTP
ncbi:hypothetical protein [Luteimonas aquatica]|uniref:hypothetical protein n=1 Tax=Luteimonas aquatica TaxID=450364 RepID=UPI001F59A7CD|nr:hypothetical protein [Luteimonas aquatica]